MEQGAVGRRIGPRRVLGLALVAAMALLLVACQPVTLGNPGAQVGNDIDPANCPASQPMPAAPCGPQPMLWASINAPYADFANGDPYATHCARGGGSGTTCTATNPDYRPEGYAYVIDVAEADVGAPLTLQGYDIGSYPRRLGNGGATKAHGRTIELTLVAGSNLATGAAAGFTSADLSQPVFMTCPTSCLASNATISSVVSATQVRLSSSATASGTFVATIGYDCNIARAPFTAYTGMSSSNCQTGDSGGTMNFDVQVYDSDGSGTPNYATPLPGCHLSKSGAELDAAVVTYKNTWVDLCAFTPAKKGAYAFRVRNSGIDGFPDVGTGFNQYALKVLGGTSTGLHAVGDQSVYVVPMASTATAYLAAVPAENAGKKIVVDLFDPGDGAGSSPITLQLLAPPGGAPATVPAGTGVTVPAAGVASSCMYNAIGSPTIGPATPDVADTCTVTTHLAELTSPNIYNGTWLRIEVTLDPAYTCSTDCWWTLRWNWGTNALGTDRITFTAKVV